MKKILLLAAIAFSVSTVAFAQTKEVVDAVEQAPAPIDWKFQNHDFNTVVMGPTADATFEFTNNTDVPVTITEAKPSCGCTTPDWTKTPILPGETGWVKASYGTDGRPGYFKKSIKVAFDNGEKTTLYISGTVVTEKNEKESDLKK